MKEKVKVQSFRRVQLFVTPWTLACQAPLSMGFFRQEYWSGLLCPYPGDPPDPGIELTSPVAHALQVDSLLLSHWDAQLADIYPCGRISNLYSFFIQASSKFIFFSEFSFKDF